MQKSSDLEKFYYLFPQTVAIIGVASNVMPAAWHTPISVQPPLYGILVSPERYTFELLKKKRCFTVSFLEKEKAELCAITGSTSGRTTDKLQKYHISHTQGEKVNGPLLHDAYGAYECVTHAEQIFGDHVLFVGEIVLIHCRHDIVTDGHLVDVNAVSPVLYFGKDRYITIDPQSLAVHTRQ